MKIPPEAKRVFKGIIYDVFQWEQELFDGSVQTFEMIKRPDTAQVVLVDGDQILLAKEEQPRKGMFYTMVGGRVDPGENAEQAAKREVLEETGFKMDALRPFADYEPLTKIDWTVHVFVASGLKRVQEPEPEPGERIELMRVSFDEFIQTVLSDQFRGREFAFDISRRVVTDEGKAQLRHLLLRDTV